MQLKTLIVSLNIHSMLQLKSVKFLMFQLKLGHANRNVLIKQKIKIIHHQFRDSIFWPLKLSLFFKKNQRYLGLYFVSLFDTTKNLNVITLILASKR